MASSCQASGTKVFGGGTPSPSNQFDRVMAGSWDSVSIGLCVVRRCGAEDLAVRAAGGGGVGGGGFGCSGGGGVAGGWRGASLFLADQGHQVGLKACTVLGRMA